MITSEETSLNWNDYVVLTRSKSLKVRISQSKGHWMMQSSLAPRKWRLILSILTYFNILLFLTSAILLIAVKWWIPVVLLCLCLILTWCIRAIGASAVLRASLEDETFYNQAILRGAIVIFKDEEFQDIHT